MSAPALHLTRRARRYSVQRDEDGFYIEIGQVEAAVRPNWRGVIGELLHRPDTLGADYVSDRILLQHVIDALFTSKADRERFRIPESPARRMALEEVARLADECRWDGSAPQIVAEVSKRGRA